MFDAFNQAKLQNAYGKLSSATLPEKDLSLDELKKLSGSGKITGETSAQPNSALASQKAQYMRDNNIKPGTDAWFKLWFARPELTGENPFGK